MASNLHRVNHSTGLVVTKMDHERVSFRVTPEGEVVERGGWGAAGPVPGGYAATSTAPVNPMAVHTVAVEDDGPHTQAGLRELINDHYERYHECSVYLAAGVGHELLNWALRGCPPPDLPSTPPTTTLPAEGAGGDAPPSEPTPLSPDVQRKLEEAKARAGRKIGNAGDAG